MNTRNHLSNETSPYLLQHADNPVDWHPWTEDAITLARQTHKPILLSIGYAACHWCHVMAHESFEDEETAKLMNQLFINIKVDREERPDLDKVYQQLHQILTRQQGGWPLTVFLSSDNLMPFFSGTYFPKESRYGSAAFKDILKLVAEYYSKESDAIFNSHSKLQNIIDQINKNESPVAKKIHQSPLIKAFSAWLAEFDQQNGGFGGAPKFPMPALLNGILYLGYNDEKLKALLLFSLEKIAKGGIYDHLGGGFFRYAVDAKWQIPHFEKMLYDNAQLIALYASAFALTQEPLFKQVAKESIQWAIDEMKAIGGGYFASLDADSEGMEGKYYLWQPAQINAILEPSQAPLFIRHYGLNKEPNFEGQWHLVDQQLSNDPLDLALSKQQLLKERNNRIKPTKDTKILSAWNALLLKGLSLSSICIEDETLLKEATELIQFCQKSLFQDNQLWASITQGVRKQLGFLDDYAFMLEACWYYLQAKWDNSVLDFARKLSDKIISDFWDEQWGGFYFTSQHHEKLVYRPKTWVDEVLPAGSAVAAMSLFRFGHLLNNMQYRQVAEKALAHTQALLHEQPQYYPNVLVLQSDYLFPPSIVILTGNDQLVQEARQLLLKHYHPHRFIFALGNDIPSVLAHYGSKNELKIFICEGSNCQEPIFTLSTLEKQLTDLNY